MSALVLAFTNPAKPVMPPDVKEAARLLSVMPEDLRATYVNLFKEVVAEIERRRDQLSTETPGEYYLSIERRCAGPTRMFWTEAWELRRQNARTMHKIVLSTPAAALTVQCLDLFVQEAHLSWPMVFLEDAQAALALLVQFNGFERATRENDHLHLCIVRGKWRAKVYLGTEKRLSTALVQHLRTLPLTDDSHGTAAGQRPTNGGGL